MRSIGFFGVVIALAFFAAVIWLIASWGWLDPHNTTAMTWVVLVVCSAILAVGMSWSHIRRRLSGQADVDESSRSRSVRGDRGCSGGSNTTIRNVAIGPMSSGEKNHAEAAAFWIGQGLR